MKKFSLFLTVFICFSASGQELARIINQETHYNVISLTEVEITEKYTIKILSKEAKFYSIFRDFSDQFRKLNSLSITIKDNFGKKIKKLNKSDVKEFGFSSSYEIDDSKLLIADPEYQLYPFIMEVESKFTLNGFLSLPTWVPRYYFNLAVDKAELNISYPKNQYMKFKVENVLLVDSILDKKDILHKKYQVEGLTAINQSTRYQDFYAEQPKVLITPIDFELDGSKGMTATWRDFGNWFYNLNEIPYYLQPSTMNVIDGITNENTRNKIKEIYNFMQDRTRYISIQLGIGGFKSMPTSDVEKNSYGDCKGLTTYMKNMLDYAGIKSHYVLVKAGNDVPQIDIHFPSSQFNHVFLGVPLETDTIYLECTSQYSPFNYVGKFTDDRDALWIDEYQSKIIHTPVYNFKQNTKSNKAIVDIHPNGNATINLKTVNTGVFYEDIFIYKQAPREYISKFNRNLFYYKDFTIHEFNYSQIDRNDPTFSTQFDINVNNIYKKLGDRILLPLNLLTPVEKSVDYNELFKFVQIKRGFKISDSVTFRLPENHWIENQPENKTIKSEYGQYIFSSSLENNQLTIKREIIFNKGVYRNENYEEFKKYLQRAIDIEKTKLILNQKT